MMCHRCQRVCATHIDPRQKDNGIKYFSASSSTFFLLYQIESRRRFWQNANSTQDFDRLRNQFDIYSIISLDRNRWKHVPWLDWINWDLFVWARTNRVHRVEFAFFFVTSLFSEEDESIFFLFRTSMTRSEGKNGVFRFSFKLFLVSISREQK